MGFLDGAKVEWGCLCSAMTDNNFRTIPSPSPSARQSPTVLPPLSKFYYGPTQGWNSAEASPSLSGSSSRSCYAHALRADESDIGSTLSLHSPHPEIPPTLPPRLSPGLPAYSSPHWRNQFPPAEGESQGWQGMLLSYVISRRKSLTRAT